MSRFSGAHPAEQNYTQWSQDQLALRQQYWLAVRRARQQYLTEFAGVYDLTVRPSLHHWMQEHYGISMGIDDQGNYTQEYTVVDPKRYMLFQLRYLS